MIVDNSQPIYRQIIDDFKKKIVRGELKQGDKISSQREYAQNIRVNPNTVQRAYREMEMMQIVETLRGQGTFICASEEMRKSLQQEMAEAHLHSFIRQMRDIGFEDERIIDLVKQYIKSEGGAEV